MSVDTDPGHEIELDTDPAEIRIDVWRTPREWWVDYRASLLARSALSDTLTEAGRLRLSIELFAVTVVIGLGWTLWVFGVLAIVGLVIGVFL